MPTSTCKGLLECLSSQVRSRSLGVLHLVQHHEALHREICRASKAPSPGFSLYPAAVGSPTYIGLQAARSHTRHCCCCCLFHVCLGVLCRFHLVRYSTRFWVAAMLMAASFVTVALSHTTSTQVSSRVDQVMDHHRALHSVIPAGSLQAVPEQCRQRRQSGQNQ